jgi:hypothetical protein
MVVYTVARWWKPQYQTVCYQYSVVGDVVEENRFDGLDVLKEEELRS